MSFRDKRIEALQLITVAVCCGNVSNLIGRRTINIPEIIFGVHAFSVSTVNIAIIFRNFNP